LVEALDQAGEAAGIEGWVSLDGFKLVCASRHAYGLRPVLHGTFESGSAGTRVSFELRYDVCGMPWAWVFNAIWPIAWVLWLAAVAAWLFGAIPLWQVIVLVVANLLLGVLLRRFAARSPSAANPIHFLHAALARDEDEHRSRLVLNVIGMDSD
jgi:hypothetical protein